MTSGWPNLDDRWLTGALTCNNTQLTGGDQWRDRWLGPHAVTGGMTGAHHWLFTSAKPGNHRSGAAPSPVRAPGCFLAMPDFSQELSCLRIVLTSASVDRPITS